MSGKINFVIFGALLLTSGVSPVFAQAVVDGGVLQQQIERERSIALPSRRPVDPLPAPQEMRSQPGMVIAVRQFRFAGNTLLPEARLATAVANFAGRPLDFGELQSAAQAVAAVYRENGWVVRAYIPEQEIEDGVVVIQIVEAVFGKLIMDGTSSRVSAARIERTVNGLQQPGEPLNGDALDRALLLADDLPGVAVTGALRAGDGQAETDLVVKPSDERLLTGDGIVDNHGARSTGAERISANVQLASPWGFGDLMTANLLHTRGSDYRRVGYSIPLGFDGLRLGASLSRFDYRLVGRDFAALKAKGDSTTRGLDISYPLIRTRSLNLFLLSGYDKRSYVNRSGATRVTDYDMDVFSLSLSGNVFDGLGGGGTNSGNLAWSSGKRRGQVGVGDQSFSKIRYSLSRQQVLTGDWSLFVLFTGQHAGKDVDSSEKFYLGGANGVRAYPTNEGGGANGRMMNLELRWRLPEGFLLTGFYDYGRVRNYGGGKSYSLEGGGFSLGWMSTSGLSVKASWARRIGSNPNPAANGDDQDGSLVKNRYWLSISQSF